MCPSLKQDHPNTPIYMNKLCLRHYTRSTPGVSTPRSSKWEVGMFGVQVNDRRLWISEFLVLPSQNLQWFQSTERLGCFYFETGTGSLYLQVWLTMLCLFFRLFSSDTMQVPVIGLWFFAGLVWFQLIKVRQLDWLLTCQGAAFTCEDTWKHPITSVYICQKLGTAGPQWSWGALHKLMGLFCFACPILLAGLSWVIVSANHWLAAWQKRAFKANGFRTP